MITVVVYRIPGNVPEVSRAWYYGYYRYFLLFIIVITNDCLCHRTICVVVLAIFTHLYVVRYFCHYLRPFLLFLSQGPAAVHACREREEDDVRQKKDAFNGTLYSVL